MTDLPKTTTSIEILKNDPQSMEVLFDHVANGGSLIELSKMWGMPYSKLMRHIRSKEDLKAKLAQAMSDREEWARESVLDEVKKMSLYDVKDAVNPDGTIKKLQELPSSLTAAIKEINADGGLKFQDKLKAIDLFGKQMGLFVDKVQVDGKITLEQYILAAQKVPRDQIPMGDDE